MRKTRFHLLKQFLLVMLCFAFTRYSNAQTGATFKQWGDETLAKIVSDFKISGSALYYEGTNSADRHPAYAWPSGIELHALIAAGKTAEAEAMANEFHTRYWCNYNNLWGYNSGADGCGDRYYDDNAWLAKALMELYFATNNTTYLNRAKDVIAFCMSGEVSTGGLSWHEGDVPKLYSLIGTIPTALSCLMAYQATNDVKYKNDGTRLYAFVKSQGWGIGPGFRGYENAVECQAAILLYYITGDVTYRNDAVHLGLAMETFYVTWATHALAETGQWGGHDMTNAYIELYRMDSDINWLNIAAGYLQYLHDHCKDANGRYPENWNDVTSGGNPMLLYQASAARGFAKMGTTAGGQAKYPDPAAVFADCNFTGYQDAGLFIGRYTTSDLQFIGIQNNGISSVKVQPGYRVTLFDTDNFTGNSLVLTADNSCLYPSAWNDHVGSMIVEPVSPIAIFYKDCNFVGRAVDLPLGNYTLAQLQQRGINNKDISSVKVTAGYQVQLFKNDNFGGDNIVLTADNSCLVNNQWNDSTSSIKISIAGSGTGDGLVGNYCNGMNFETPVITRKDANINFDWGSGSPMTGINADAFSVRWTGQIQPRYSETYTFYLNSDNGRRLWINGQLVVDRWVDDCCTEYSGSISLTAGQKYDIKLEYFENVGLAGCKLEWSSSSQGREVVPQSQLYSGDGLTGNYFNGMNFETAVISRKDKTINFDWGAGSPLTGINADQFSARWTGLILPRYTGTYTFYISSDNGRRLWINNQLVIDKWVDDCCVEYSGNIALTSGQKYDIKLEYFENVGLAGCKLEWSSSSQGREVVPQSQLFSSSALKSGQIQESDEPKSAQTASELTKTGNTFEAFPNPMGNLLTIRFGSNVYKKVSIIDMTGKVVLSSVIPNQSGEIQLDVSGLSKGAYYVRLQGDNCINGKLLSK